MGARQRRYFYYLTGCELSDCHYIYDMSTSRSTLFIPPINPDSVIWSGLPVSASEALSLYDIDEVKYTTEVNTTLTHYGSSPSNPTVFAIAQQVSDSVTFLGYTEKNFSILKEAIETCRVVKDEFEIAIIRKANAVSTAAHHAVMGKVKKVDNERQLEGVFLERCIAQGAREQAYHSIVASGRAAATLHYVRNDAPMAGKLNLLLDAGAEWKCYASDIVRRPHTNQILPYLLAVLTSHHRRPEHSQLPANSPPNPVQFTTLCSKCNSTASPP
jgi:Xaa-Pro dipeptidase